MTRTRTISGSVNSGSDLEEEGSSSMQQARDAESSLQEHLNGAQTAVDQLLRQIKAFRSENNSLKQRLKKAEGQNLQATSPRARRLSTSEGLHIQVAALKNEVEELKTENKKQKKKIEKLRQKEVEAEAKDLKSSAKYNDDGEIDPEYRMRKLLRKFSDYMLINTISDDSEEPCPICLEPFVKNKCSSLQCQHIICHECLPKISRGADETVHCPVCRNVTERQAVELVHMTEKDRWDQLLNIAQAWAAFDNRGMNETSEEESEENFINDGGGTSSASTQYAPSHIEDTSDDDPLLQQDMNSDDEGRSNASSSDTTHRLRSRPSSYKESPTKAKRKILEQLAEERENKRRR